MASLIEHRVLLAAHSIDIGGSDAGSIADAVKQPKRALLSNGLWLAYDDNAAFSQGVPISQQQQLPSDAPCVFYFHGLMSSRLERHPSAGTFGVRIITVDRPGQGMSDHCHYTYEDFSGFICELADILGIKKFGVVGFSSGGPYALAIAYAEPCVPIPSRYLAQSSPSLIPLLLQLLSSRSSHRLRNNRRRSSPVFSNLFQHRRVQ